MIVVVGAGPGGIAAAMRARGCGADVTVVDDNPSPGGQIWRAMPNQPEVVRFAARDIRYIAGARAIAGDPLTRTVLVESVDGAREIRYKTLIVATGSRELFLPFPGWTLPGVFGAGGLQAMAKSGLPVRGKRVVVAGTGPLLLAAAAYLRGRGADVRLIAEQVPWRALAGLAAETMGRNPAKLAQAAGLGWALAGVPYFAGCWVEAAHGDGLLRSVTLRRGRDVWDEACDYAAIGYGLCPNTEVAAMMRGAGGEVLVPRTGDVELATVEGEIAGCLAAGRHDLARALEPRRQRARRFARSLDRTFAPRAELRSLPGPDTIVCRCEGVRFARLRGFASFRAAKLETRCGMGACQGRVCGPALRYLFGWQDTSVRPPVFPARLGSLIQIQKQ